MVRKELSDSRQNLADYLQKYCGGLRLIESRRGNCGHPLVLLVPLPSGDMEANAMTFSSEWREPDPYRYVRDLDSAGFAWELLRRNSRYRSEAADASGVSVPAAGYLRIEAPPGHGPSWGLSFRASG